MLSLDLLKISLWKIFSSVLFVNFKLILTLLITAAICIFQLIYVKRILCLCIFFVKRIWRVLYSSWNMEMSSAEILSIIFYQKRRGEICAVYLQFSTSTLVIVKILMMWCWQTSEGMLCDCIIWKPLEILPSRSLDTLLTTPKSAMMNLKLWNWNPRNIDRNCARLMNLKTVWNSIRWFLRKKGS